MMFGYLASMNLNFKLDLTVTAFYNPWVIYALVVYHQKFIKIIGKKCRCFYPRAEWGVGTSELKL